MLSSSQMIRPNLKDILIWLDDNKSNPADDKTKVNRNFTILTEVNSNVVTQSANDICVITQPDDNNDVIIWFMST